jgi:hypothetical protein
MDFMREEMDCWDSREWDIGWLGNQREDTYL